MLTMCGENVEGNIRTEVQHVMFPPKVCPPRLSLLDPQLLNPPLRQSSDCPQAMTPSKHRQKSSVSSLATLKLIQISTLHQRGILP